MHAAERRFTIGDLLRDSGLVRAEAELLLRCLLACERVHLITHAEEPVEVDRALAALNWFERRRAGEPVAHITGRREFYGLTLGVTADVLIPRPETERLVELALERIPANSRARVVDLGTGCGAIAIALALERPRLSVIATDISDAALEVARRNARELAAKVEFWKSDWFSGLGPGQFDMIASNPPYVAAGDTHLMQGDLRFEPRVALVGGKDGMACIRRVAENARDRLLSGGWLLLEHGYDQGDRCLELFRALDYADIRDFEDLGGIPRVCAGRKLN